MYCAYCKGEELDDDDLKCLEEFIRLESKKSDHKRTNYNESATSSLRSDGLNQLSLFDSIEPRIDVESTTDFRHLEGLGQPTKLDEDEASSESISLFTFPKGSIERSLSTAAIEKKQENSSSLSRNNSTHHSDNLDDSKLSFGSKNVSDPPEKVIDKTLLTATVDVEEGSPSKLSTSASYRSRQSSDISERSESLRESSFGSRGSNNDLLDLLASLKEKQDSMLGLDATSSESSHASYNASSVSNTTKIKQENVSSRKHLGAEDESSQLLDVENNEAFHKTSSQIDLTSEIPKTKQDSISRTESMPSHLPRLHIENNEDEIYQEPSQEMETIMYDKINLESNYDDDSNNSRSSSSFCHGFSPSTNNEILRVQTNQDISTAIAPNEFDLDDPESSSIFLEESFSRSNNGNDENYFALERVIPNEEVSLSSSTSHASIDWMLSGEVDELNELLNREEKGLNVDEDRIYELDLLSRWTVGEELTQDESTDLESFRKRRKKEEQSRHSSRHQDINFDIIPPGLESSSHGDVNSNEYYDEKGRSYNEYNTGAFQSESESDAKNGDSNTKAREYVPATLSAPELNSSSKSNSTEPYEIDVMSISEKDSVQEPDRNVAGSEEWRPPNESYFFDNNNDVFRNQEPARGLAPPGTTLLKEDDSTSNQEQLHHRFVEEDENDSFDAEIRLMEELEQKRIDAKRTRLKKKMRLAEQKRLDMQKKFEEEARMEKETKIQMKEDRKRLKNEARRVKDDKRKEKEQKRLEKEAARRAIKQRQIEADHKERVKEARLAEIREKIEGQRKQLVDEERLVEEKIMTERELRRKLKKEASVAKKSRKNLEKERQRFVQAQEQKILKGRSRLDEIKGKEILTTYRDETNKSLGPSQHLLSLNDIFATASIYSDEVPSNEETSNSSCSRSIAYSESNEAVLSVGEIDELNELLDREELGESVDEDRIYELDLFSRWQVGEELDEEEANDLKEYRKRKRKQRKGSKSNQQYEKQKPKDNYSHNKSRVAIQRTISSPQNELEFNQSKSPHPESKSRDIFKHFDSPGTFDASFSDDSASLPSSKHIDDVLSNEVTVSRNICMSPNSPGTFNASLTDDSNSVLSTKEISDENQLFVNVTSNSSFSKNSGAVDKFGASSKPSITTSSSSRKGHSNTLASHSSSHSRSSSGPKQKKDDNKNHLQGQEPPGIWVPPTLDFSSQPNEITSIGSSFFNSVSNVSMMELKPSKGSLSSSSSKPSPPKMKVKAKQTKGDEKKENFSSSSLSSTQISSVKQKKETTEDNKIEKENRTTPVAIELTRGEITLSMSQKDFSVCSASSSLSSSERQRKEYSKHKNKKSRGIDDVSDRSIKDHSSSQFKKKKKDVNHEEESLSHKSADSDTKGFPRSTEEKLNTAEHLELNKKMQKAYDNLLAWDDPHDEPLSKSEISKTEIDDEQNEILENVEKEISTWTPKYTFNPFTHITQSAHTLQEKKMHSIRPDPPPRTRTWALLEESDYAGVVDGAEEQNRIPLPVVHEEPTPLPSHVHTDEKGSNIREARYIHEINDDSSFSSITSNWGPPSLLKIENRKGRKSSRSRKNYDSYNPSVQYDQSSEEAVDESTNPYQDESMHVPSTTPQTFDRIPQQHQTVSVDTRRDRDSNNSSEKFRGFDPNLLLTSWGLSVLDRVPEETDIRSVQAESMVTQPYDPFARNTTPSLMEEGEGTDSDYHIRNTVDDSSKASSWGFPGRDRSLPHHSITSKSARSSNFIKEIRINNDLDGRRDYYADNSISQGISIYNFDSELDRDHDDFGDLERGFSEPRFPPRSTGTSCNNSKKSSKKSRKLSGSRRSSNEGEKREEEDNDDNNGECDQPLRKVGFKSFDDEPMIPTVQPERKRKRRIVCSLILLLVLLALIGIGTSVYFFWWKKQEKSEPIDPPVDSAPPIMVPSSSPPLPFPTPAVTGTIVPTVPPTAIVAPSSMVSPPIGISTPDDDQSNCCNNYGTIKDLIVANAADGGESLKDLTSPQSKALQWMELPMNANASYSDSRLLQRYALVTLYYATNSNNDGNVWTMSTRWLTNTNECTWFSTSESPNNICSTSSSATNTTTIITFNPYEETSIDTSKANNNDSKNERESIYLELDLRENNLVGTIPDEIGLLSSLRIIRLPKNSLSSTIPSIIAKTMSQLKHVDLSSNKLVQGDIMDDGLVFDNRREDTPDNIYLRSSGTIPAAAAKNSELVPASHDRGFLSYLNNMQSLTHLDIYDNSIQTKIPTHVWGASSDGISDEGGKRPSSPLSDNLKVLNLGSNMFYGTLPSEIGLLTALTGLSVFDNQLSGTLPESISKLSRLESLYVDSNRFSNAQINNNDVLGVPWQICSELRPVPLKEFWADCEQIGCTCCTTCCSDELGCIAV